MKKSQKRKLSAFLLLICIILIIAVIIIVKDRNLFSGSNRIYTIADNVAGLNTKDAVMIKGMNVGLVKDISFLEDGSARPIILMKIDKKYNIPVGSSARIVPNENNLSKFIVIETVNSDVFLKDNDTLKFIGGVDMSGEDGLVPLKQKTAEMLESFDTVIQVAELLSKYNDDLLDSLAKDKEKNVNSVVYRIQILTTQKEIPLNVNRFNDLSDVWRYFHNGVYKYTVGMTYNYETAHILKKDFNKKGYPEAFIVAFEDGKRISMQKK